MNYQEIVRKYEGKKRGLLAALIIFEAVIMAVIIASDLFLQDMLEEAGVPDSFGPFTGRHSIAVCAVIGAVMLAADLLVIRLMKDVRGNIRRIQEETGLTDDDRFAEVYNTCHPLPSLKNVLLGDQYLLNFDSWWGCRLDSITSVRKEVSPAVRIDDNAHFTVKVEHNGKVSSIYTSEPAQKKVYAAVYKAAGLPEEQE